MGWLEGLDLTTIEAVQFGTREWLYVMPETDVVVVGDKGYIEFKDQFSEHMVRGKLDAVSVVRFKK